MIATGLVFLLGALVAILVFLLFIPILWRNAQRLARRDFVATMPATIGEIRAEVDRVRAETAVNVRRHEMSAQKARERAARERAEVGRLTAAHAEAKHHREAFEAQANALRGELSLMTQHAQASNEALAQLQGEHETLRDEVERLRAEAGSLREALQRSEAEAQDDEDSRTAAHVEALSTSLATNAAAAPRPSAIALKDAGDEEIRERIADIAAGIIHRTAAADGPQSPLAPLIESGGEPTPPAPSRGAPRSLADRVRQIAAADVTARTGAEDKRDGERSPQNLRH